MSLRTFSHACLVALHMHGGRRRILYGTIAGTLALFFLLIAFLLLLPPAHFPKGAVVVVPEDASLGEIGAMLEERGIIRSTLAFKAVGRIMRADTRIKAGNYQFNEPLGLSSVLYRLEAGISGIPVVRITFPEGMTAREMGEALYAALPGFDGNAFETLGKPYEGYLFPDTYDFPMDTTPEEAVQRLHTAFLSVEKKLETRIEASGRTREEIVTMASLLEREARTLEERRIIAGILWDRIELGMALQVDAVFGYIKGITTYHPTGDDLDIDSPYNTYKNPGLPPGPIANPGLESLEAALTPTDTKYLYYLTGDDGVMHYAETFEEHKANKERYLK